MYNFIYLYDIAQIIVPYNIIDIDFNVLDVDCRYTRPEFQSYPLV